MLNYLKKNWFLLLIVIMLALSSYYLYVSYKNEKKIRESLEKIDSVDSNNVFNREYYEEEISALKRKNKALYDSIYAYKDKVSYLLQFKYEKEYDTGVVDTNNKPQPKDTTNNVTPKDSIFEYHYANELNDTLNYRLTIGALSEPYWYRLNVKLSDKFTIINKDNGDGTNTISIGGQGQGTITDVTTFTKKDEYGFFDRFAVGPSVSFGYDPFTKKFYPVFGVSVTYDLLKHKKTKK